MLKRVTVELPVTYISIIQQIMDHADCLLNFVLWSSDRTDPVFTITVIFKKRRVVYNASMT